MPYLNQLGHFLLDSPPDFLFEVSEGGIAYVRPGPSLLPGFEPFEPDVVSVSPLRDNILRPDALAATVQKLTSGANRRRGKAALILPDFCARVTVLDFDEFPADAKERLSLVRFRLKKTVPFDVDSATVSFFVQPRATPPSKINVVAAVAASEIIARYEAPFRAAGMHPGFVTTSALAALHLDRSPELTALAKLSGKVLTVLIINAGVLRLVRSVELEEVTGEEVMSVLFPTIAYTEDELGARPSRLLLCGLDETAGFYATRWETELGLSIVPLRSRYGAPSQHNSGLLGYLESVVAKAA